MTTATTTATTTRDDAIRAAALFTAQEWVYAFGPSQCNFFAGVEGLMSREGWLDHLEATGPLTHDQFIGICWSAGDIAIQAAADRLLVPATRGLVLAWCGDQVWGFGPDQDAAAADAAARAGLDPDELDGLTYSTIEEEVRRS
jgi:hypothetical protein